MKNEVVTLLKAIGVVVVGVILAPAFRWSIVMAPLMMRFLKPKSFDALIVPTSAIIESPQWQNDISYQFYY